MQKSFLPLFFLLWVPALLLAQSDPLASVKQKMDTGDFAGARALLNSVLETDPKNKSALTLRAEARMGQDEYYGAITDLSYEIELDSADSQARNLRGEAKMLLRNDEGEIDVFEKSIRLIPNFPDAYTNRGLARYNIVV